jgi:hypothetical protein
MRGRSRESELVETPLHPAEIWLSVGACGPLSASGAREAARLGNRRRSRPVLYRSDMSCAIGSLTSNMPDRSGSAC